MWRYVEQASASSLDTPYRQRVYFVHRLNDELFESKVYALNDPLRFAGEWRDPEPLKNLTPDSLVSRDGCSIILRMRGTEAFVGNTGGKECSSDLRGASYAVSEKSMPGTVSRISSNRAMAVQSSLRKSNGRSFARSGRNSVAIRVTFRSNSETCYYSMPDAN